MKDEKEMIPSPRKNVVGRRFPSPRMIEENDLMEMPAGFHFLKVGRGYFYFTRTN